MTHKRTFRNVGRSMLFRDLLDVLKIEYSMNYSYNYQGVFYAVYHYNRELLRKKIKEMRL